MSLILDEHRQYLSDNARIAALSRAIQEVIKPGMVVLDLGCGTGILGLMACRAGASKVYAIEEGGMIEVARSVARDNGFGDRIHHLQGHSSRISLPERVDVVVADQIGRFGFEAGVIQYYADARRRFLKPGGILVPSGLELLLAPVDCPELRENVDFWNGRPAGFDFSSASSIARNTGYPLKFSPSHLLGSSQVAASVDLTTDVPLPIRLAAQLVAGRPGTLHGIAGWFSARLSQGVCMTNSPTESDAIRRMNVFFPLESAVPVQEGQAIAVSMTILPQDALVSWKVSVGGTTYTHSTLLGMLVSAEELRRTRGDSCPRLNPWGEARATVLSLCDGRRPLSEIEKEVQRRHSDLFISKGAAETFVAEVVTRYGL